MEIDILVSNAIIYTQSATVPDIYISIEHTYTPQQLVATNIRLRSLGEAITWKQSLQYTQPVHNITINQQYSPSSFAEANTIFLTAQSYYLPVHSAQLTEWEQVGNLYVPSQSIVVSKSSGAASFYAPSGSVSFAVERVFACTSIYSPNGFAAILNSLLGAEFIATGRPTITPSTTVTFTFGGFSFSCKAPIWDNSTELQFSRVSRRSRGGDLIIFRDPMWPESMTLKMEFTFLTTLQKDNFIKLFQLSLGEIVYYQDYLGQTWQGLILNPGEPVTKPNRMGFATKVELQGGLV